MTVQRTDIEKALGELISNEEGMKFQGLAIILARQKWPELIACERKKDLGLDAYAPARLTRDGVGKGLACSISAGIFEKIKKDAISVKKNFDDVKVLIFATPRQVTNQAAQQWINEIWNEFGYKLVIMPREDIVISLMDPTNVSLCRTELGIPVVIGAAVNEIAEKARDATREVTTTWLTHLRPTGRPYVDLRAVKLDQDGKETGEILRLEDIKTALLEARRVVVEAPAGRGKTTTLAQLARQEEDMAGISLLIDLPEWARSGQDILDFVTQMPPFRSRGISAENLATLYKVEQFSFLLNGWNEISETYVEAAVVALRQLERDYPKAGISVATRTHYITPPLPGAFRVALLPLTWAQREEYLRRSLESRAQELGSKLDNDPALDQLTRTPFILSEVINIFQSGRTIPTTRIGILSEVVRLLEESDQHRSYLQARPLTGYAEHYLEEIAIRMMGQGTTTVIEKEARSIAKSVSDRLKDTGQIETSPEPASVLNSLCAHHVLERLNYQTDTFRFEHQQFQELYATLFLKRQLFEILETDSEERERAFARSYINDPKWEEPLRMLAEEIEAQSVDATRAQAEADLVAAGKRLVEMTLTVDPILAAELSRLCGELVWKQVRTAIGERLRSWYNTNEENNRQCAIAGMLATGSGDFADIILPLLTSDDSQVRLSTYRAGAEFHPSALGADWKSIVSGWPEKARIEFVSELAMQGSNIEAPASVEYFASTDPSPKVRAEAAHGLIWYPSFRGFARVLEALDDEAFEQAAQELDARSIPPSARQRALAVRRRLLDQSAEPAKRLQILLESAVLGEDGIPEKLKEQLSQLEPTKLQNLGQFLIKPALDIIRKEDLEWVSHWVADRILDGSLWPDHWISFVINIPESLKEELLETIASKDIKEVGKWGIIPLLKATGDGRLTETAWAKLFEAQRAIFDATDAPNQTERALAKQLEELIAAFAPNAAVAGLSKYFTAQVDIIEFTTVIEVFSRVGNDAPDLRNELQSELRHGLHAYLKNSVEFTLVQDDFNGRMKAYLATALARVGEPEDIIELRRLIRADIERVKNGRIARARREPGPPAQGAAICWAHWHVRALTLLASHAAEETLLELLCEQDADLYENEAASALVRLAMARHLPDPFNYKMDYRSVWAIRSGSQPVRFDDERQRRYANAIKERILTLLSERANNAQSTWYGGRLKGLAKQLAVLDGRRSSELVMQVMALPGEWDASLRVEALEALLLSGADLPTEATLEILNPAIQQICDQGINDHNAAWMLGRCLCLLPFVDEPAIGIERIRQVISETPLWPTALRDIFGALGSSRCNAALDLLTELAGPDGSRMPEAFKEWGDAVATFGGSESTRILLSFIDPEAEGFEIPEDTARHGEDETIVSRIADLARLDAGAMQRILQLCDMNLPPAKRLLLARVIERLGRVDAILAGLNIIDDSCIPSIPYELQSALENLFLERRPYDNKGSSYVYEPRSANEVRTKLFEMASTDTRRKASASALLGQIRVWRLEHGRPSDEPRHPAFDAADPYLPIEETFAKSAVIPIKAASLITIPVKSKKRFLIALSFPGEHRTFVKGVAHDLSRVIDQQNILYDEFWEAEFARPNLDTHLQALYHDESTLIVVFLCADYARKEWTGLEWRAIRDLIKKKQDASIMFISLDDAEIPGVFSIDGYVPVHNRQPSDIAALIIERLEAVLKQPLPAPGTSSSVSKQLPVMNNASRIDDSLDLPEQATQTSYKTLDSLRNDLGSRVTPILGAVWDDLEQPFSKTDPALLYDQFGKEAVRACLSINPNPLLRCDDQGAYSITLLGALITREGQHIEELLIRYVGYIRNRHRESKYKLKEITSSELEKDLKLTPEEMTIMWKLWGIPSPFFVGGSGARDKWRVNLPSDIYDIPLDPEQVPAYVRRVVESYNINAPAAMSDAARGWRSK